MSAEPLKQDTSGYGSIFTGRFIENFLHLSYNFQVKKLMKTMNSIEVIVISAVWRLIYFILVLLDFLNWTHYYSMNCQCMNFIIRLSSIFRQFLWWSMYIHARNCCSNIVRIDCHTNWIHIREEFWINYHLNSVPIKLRLLILKDRFVQVIHRW